MRSKTAKVQTIVRGKNGTTIDKFEMLNIYEMSPFTDRTKLSVVLSDGTYISNESVDTIVRTLRDSNYFIAADQIMIASLLRSKGLTLYRNGKEQPLSEVPPHILWHHVEAHSQKLDSGADDALGVAIVRSGEVLAYHFSNAYEPVLHIGELMKTSSNSNEIEKMLMTICGAYITQRRSDEYDTSFVDNMKPHMRSLILE